MGYSSQEQWFPCGSQQGMRFITSTAAKKRYSASVCPLTVGQSSEQFGKFYRPAIILCAQMASAGADDFQLVGVPPMKRRTKEDRSGVALGAGISPFGVAWSTTCGNASASTVRILSGSVPA